MNSFPRASLVIALVLTGCGKADAPPAAGGDANAPAAAAGGAKSGRAVGRLLEEGGRVISVPGAKLSVSLWGVSSKSGEQVSYNPPVGADGSYSQKLADGSYAFSGARIDVPFDGKHFVFDLEPVGDDHVNRESEPGIVQDYVWKLKGLRAGQDPDESNFTRWHGVSVAPVFAGYREDVKKPAAKPPAGAKCVFTLRPKGKIVDGTDGETLTFAREYDPLLGGLKIPNLPDVPLGVYVLTGVETAPDGTKTPLLMGLEYAKFGNSKEIHFAPGSSTGAWPCNVSFTR